MTVYCVYENLDEIGIPKGSQGEYGHEIVAFTNDKKIFKEYMRVRKKKLFLIEKHHMDMEDYVSFANRNRLQMIEYQELTSIDRKDLTYREIKIPMTSYQYSNMVEAQERLLVSMMGAVITHKVFKRKYRDALKALEYDKMDALVNYPSELDDIGLPEFIYDQVKMYANMCDNEFE